MKGVHVTAMLVIAGSAAAVVAPLRSPEKPSSSQAPPAPFVATVQNENEWLVDRGPATGSGRVATSSEEAAPGIDIASEVGAAYRGVTLT